MSKKVVAPLFLPVLMYCVFVASKIFGFDTGANNIVGLHVFMAMFFLVIGFSVSYFVVILSAYEPFRSNDRASGLLWPLSSVLFFILFADVSVGIHEELAWVLNHKLGLWGPLCDSAVFIAYAVILVLIIACFRKTFGRFFWISIGLFVLCSSIAVVADSVSKGLEGIITVFGRDFSYEQALETFSTLMLTAAFVSEAVIDLTRSVRSNS